MRIMTLLATLVLGAQQTSQTVNTHSSMRGIVLQLNGHPLANATVYALNSDQMTSPPKETKARSDGTFEFSDLVPGSFFLDADKPEEGYVYSLFSFYIMPGQQKPQVEIVAGKTTSGVVVKLGQKVAYIDLVLSDGSAEPISASVLFTRDDLPGNYKRSLQAGMQRIPVPPVPFSMSIQAVGFIPWSYRNQDGTAVVNLQPGDVLPLVVKLEPIR